MRIQIITKMLVSVHSSKLEPWRAAVGFKSQGLANLRYLAPGEETRHRHPVGWLWKPDLLAFGITGHPLPAAWLLTPSPFFDFQSGHPPSEGLLPSLEVSCHWPSSSFWYVVTILIFRLGESSSHLVTCYFSPNWLYMVWYLRFQINKFWFGGNFVFSLCIVNRHCDPENVCLSSPHTRRLDYEHNHEFFENWGYVAPGECLLNEWVWVMSGAVDLLWTACRRCTDPWRRSCPPLLMIRDHFVFN